MLEVKVHAMATITSQPPPTPSATTHVTLSQQPPTGSRALSPMRPMMMNANTTHMLVAAPTRSMYSRPLVSIPWMMAGAGAAVPSANQFAGRWNQLRLLMPKHSCNTEFSGRMYLHSGLREGTVCYFICTHPKTA